MKIVFMGTPDFAVPSLHALTEAGYAVAAVVTQPDKPKGRGKTLLPTPVKEEAVMHDIPGQSVDVENDGKPLEKEMLDYIYRNKTSALIEASMMTGAILAGANEQEVSAVEKAAGNIGLAFQIQDDILDVTSTAEELGKPVHSDEKNNKVTYVTLFGTEKAAEQVEELSEKAIDLLKSLNKNNEFLYLLIEKLINRRK